MRLDQKPQAPSLGAKPYLSPLAAWALAFGCSVGWGAFVMPGTTFLPIAGPLGSVLGLLIGAFVMFVFGFCYHCLMKRYPDEGGIYTYSKKHWAVTTAFCARGCCF
ncbi:MAG: APC family permease [Ruminococcus sp.]|nr:APC family permease [Ruminococcus sp.]